MENSPHLPTLWVSAAPFRYHVQHLMASTGVPWQVIAVAADLPQQQVRTLLFGRDGHRRPRLSPYAARRLLALDVAQLRRLQICDLPIHFVTDSARALLADGVSLDEIAEWLDLDLHSTRRVVSGLGGCSQTMDIMLRLACVQRRLLMEPESRDVA
jgi:hypothetical protein